MGVLRPCSGLEWWAMSGAMIEIIILAAVAGFLFLRLREVLGRRTGHENPTDWGHLDPSRAERHEAGTDTVIPFPGAEQPDPATVHADIAAVTELDGPIGATLVEAKDLEPDFDAQRFLEGSRAAYEMILMGFEAGDKTTLRPLLADDVFESFESVIDQRATESLSVDARFVGLRSSKIEEARLHAESRQLQIDVRFDAEMIVAVRNAEGEIVDGDPTAVRRMNDLWTFQRQLGDPNPGWLLVETGD